MSVVLHQIGFSYYVESEGRYFPITYPHYQALVDYQNDVIEHDEIRPRIKHYESMSERIPCPWCDGELTRGMAEMMTSLYEGDDLIALHESIAH